MTTYKRATVYVRVNAKEPFVHMEYPDKETALEHVRGIKSTLGVEPQISFTESDNADVVGFTFKNTEVSGRIVLHKRELEEWVHCPSCGNTLTRDEEAESHCHGWEGKWWYDHNNAIWRLTTLNNVKGVEHGV